MLPPPPPPPAFSPSARGGPGLRGEREARGGNTPPSALRGGSAIQGGRGRHRAPRSLPALSLSGDRLGDGPPIVPPPLLKGGGRRSRRRVPSLQEANAESHMDARRPGPTPPPSLQRFPPSRPPRWGGRGERRGRGGPSRKAQRDPREHCRVNDPAAGSPTATLLRLLLPPAMRYWPNSSFTEGVGAVPGGPVLPSPLLVSSGLYPSAIGSNDGRCVQMAGTQSAQADDLHLLGIPRSRRTVASTDPQSRPKSLGISQFIIKPRELLDSGGPGRRGPSPPKGRVTPAR